jgi:hypothetical protein
MENSALWPALPLAQWKDTYAALHLRTQVVGKVRLGAMPWINHAWHVALYVSARGLTTSAVPYGQRTFELEFDFLRDELALRTSDGGTRAVALRPQSIAAFHREVTAALRELGIDIAIRTMPNEIVGAIPFERDTAERPYDADAARRFWRALVAIERVFTEFRARFIGKCSPVHFFWGSFDLAVTRFSGRTAPPHAGGVPNLPDWVAREAYSHEVSSAGFWPGGGAIDYPAFYSYAYPAPEGFAEARIEPAAAFYSRELGEFLLPYDEVRLARSPEATLREFLASTYDAAANLGRWDRKALERAEDPQPRD